MKNSTTHPNILYWLAANRLQGIGPITIKHCLTFVKDIKSLFRASKTDLQTMGLSLKQMQSILDPDWRSAEADLTWCEKNACHLLCLEDDGYPKLLNQTADPPLVLFVKGNVELLSEPQIAMVGSRNPTIYGNEEALQFAKCLAKSGLIITSGLALGIDTASHSGALLENGKTIAVLGTGLATIYPFSNRSLAKAILEKGAWVSEFPPSELPRAKNFPRRNRIISGLSLGVLVVEAAIRSGSLITARFALEQARDVFAIPGSIHNPLSRGCHELIRQGAKLVEKVEDILDELGAIYAYSLPKNQAIEMPDIEKLDVKSKGLLKQIAYEVTPLDVIILRSGLTASQVSSMLLSLELLGCIKSVHGGYVRLIHV